MAGRTNQSAAEGHYGGFATTRVKDFMRLPYLGLNERRGARDSAWFEKFIKQNTAEGEYWRAISYQGKDNYARVTALTLNISGWFDVDYPGTSMNYLGMKAFGATAEARRPRMVIGHWPHGINRSTKVGKFDYGALAVIDWDGYVCRWFDH